MQPLKHVQMVSFKTDFIGTPRQSDRNMSWCSTVFTFNTGDFWLSNK